MRWSRCVAAAIVLGSSLQGCTKVKPPRPPKPDPVATALVTSGNVPIEAIGLGQVQAYNTAVVRSQVSGQILRVLFTEGQTVRKGAPVVQIDPRPLQAIVAQDQATRAKDQAALADAITLLGRDVPLAAKGLVSAQQLDTQRSQVAQLRAVDAADAAVIRRDGLQLDYASVRAPFDGVTGLRLIDVGNLVGPTDPQGLVSVSQVQPIAVVFTLPQSRLPAIRMAMQGAGAAGAEVDAYAQGDAVRLDTGRLKVISNQVDALSGTITVKAIFPNPRRVLWPGESVEAHLILARRANGLTVPTSAVQRSDKGALIWVVGSDATVSPKSVRVGATVGDRIIVEDGLAAGREVVVDGQFGLTPGAHVTRVKASGAPGAGALKTQPPESLGLTP